MKLLPGLAFALMLLPAAVSAAELRSEYTDLDFDQCTTISADEMGSTSVCAGLRGFPVVISEGDLRQSVSYGVRPLEEKAVEQSFPPFNHVGTRIEWLVDPLADNGPVPVATILRWFIAGPDGEDKGQILVVTQIKPGATCHIAYIDALAVSNANEMARTIAREKAGSFDCGKEPQTVQPFGAY